MEMKMNKKKTTIVKLMVSLILALVLCLGTATPAFANDAQNPSNPKAAITKILTMSAGAQTPNKDFVFEFTPQTVDEVNYQSGATQGQPGYMPKVNVNNTVSIVFDPTETGRTSNGEKVVKIQHPDIFEGVVWPHAGEFVYRVKEKVPTPPGDYTYSQAIYDFHVFVANDPVLGLVVKGIGTYVIYDNDGNDVASAKQKVDSSPGSGYGESEESDKFSKASFTNKYSKTTGGGTDPTEPADQILNISKTVPAGPFVDLTRYFNFQLTLKAPTGTTPADYRAYIIDGAKVITDYALNYSGTIVTPGDSYGAYFNVNVSTSEIIVNFNLKSGESLVFVKLPLGTEYTVKELAHPRYTPKAVVKALASNGYGTATINFDSAGIGEELATGSFIITDALKDENDNYIANSAAFTNTLQNTAPTGISVDNLPFVMLIVFAIVALAGYVVFRTRRTAAKAGK